MAKRRTYRKKRTYRKRRGGTRRRVSNKRIKRIVRKVIARQTENKVSQFIDLNKILRVTSDTAGFDAINVIALGCQTSGYNIPQGVGQSQRIGNKIRVKRAVIKGTMVPMQYNATTNPVPAPCQVKMVLFYDREGPTSIPTPASNADIFDFNNSTNSFHGDLVDMFAPFNTERYRILKTRIFKLGYATSDLTSTGTGSLNYANNDFKYNCNFSINYTKYLPKVQTFRDNNIDSTTRQLYLMWIPVAATGGAFLNTVRPVGVQYTCTLQYEDA